MPTWPNRPVEWYIEALNDADVRVRRQAVAALEALGDPRVVGPLLQTLGADVDPDLRGRAAAALAKLGDRQAVGPLIAALHDPDAEVSCRAQALCREAGCRGVSRRAERYRLARAVPGGPGISCAGRRAGHWAAHGTVQSR